MTDVEIYRGGVTERNGGNHADSTAETPVESMVLDGIGGCFLKREDVNPTGSHKDRAAIRQIAYLVRKGISAAVISSSGNAAAALAHRGAREGVLIFSFLSVRTPPEKISAVAREGQPVILTPKPVNHARYAARMFNLPDLRPSVDPRAVEGFMSLGFEISRQFRSPPDALFMYVSSGASLLGIARAFQAVIASGVWDRMPALHAVQSGRAVGLAAELDSRRIEGNQQSYALPGGLPSSRLYPELLKWIRHSGGSAWAVRNDELESARSMLAEKGVRTSMESIAAVAGAQRWCTGGAAKDRILIILTGCYRRFHKEQTSNITVCDSYRDIKRYFESYSGEFHDMER